ncbi:MAG: hypothetical protein GX979_01040 [Firmicutes bacterium]|nr:hypothetical protein [Bacillota bacterium]
MKICPDCHAANRSHLSYCQKCSGALTNRIKNAYPNVEAKKKVSRRPINFASMF